MTTVKFIHSAMAGAPVLSGLAGALVGVLDACLVNGFGSKTIDTLTVASNVATASISTGHSAEVDTVIEIAGASPAGLNGQWRVTAVTANTLSFATTGISDQTATGTITTKIAAAGWTKPFSGTNVAAYRSPNVVGSQPYLRVDDTTTANSRVVGYETMTDANTGTGPFPTAAQLSGGGFWGKSSATDSTARPWILVGDDRAFYLMVSWPNTTFFGTFFFGDINSLKSPDPFTGALSCAAATLVGQAAGANTTSDLFYVAMNVDANMWIERGVSGIGGAQRLRKSAATVVGSGIAFQSGAGSLTYPNGADNGLYVSQLGAVELTPLSAFRGTLPGAYASPQSIGAAAMNTREKITGVAGLSGRKLLAVVGESGPGFLDITGPWR